MFQEPAQDIKRQRSSKGPQNRSQDPSQDQHNQHAAAHSNGREV